ncbi:AraC family transcriptional regulator [Streptomyces venezuelae]|uniref:AraC family transcriptional regulator n=1 Tax=Streptomyces venezuelae TaxID=54571 RepID=UPI003640935F
MDVVSDAISAVRIGQPSSQRVRVGGDWCTRLAPYEGAGFHVVLEGRCLLLPDGGEPVELGAGDAVLLPHGTGHVIAAAAPGASVDPARAVPFERWMDGTAGRRFPHLSTATATEDRTATATTEDITAEDITADDGTAVEMLCGKYRLDRRHAHPLLAELPPLVRLPARGEGADPGLRSAIELLGREVGERLPGSGVALPSLLDLLLVYMIRSWATAASSTADGGGAGTWPAALGDPVTAAALRAVHADPAAPWTVALLAAEAGVSRPTLARRFTALVGRPPMAYLTWWRLTRGAALLRDGREPLAAVARHVGYSTPYAFSHAFRREFGTTPGQYRAGPGAATA